MRLALDTNRYTDFVRGEASAVEAIQAATKVFIPFVVLAELRAGFRCGRKAKENEANPDPRPSPADRHRAVCRR